MTPAVKSIRSYLLSRLVGGSALVLALAGLVVYLVVGRSLAAQFDRNLADRVLGLASLLFQEQDHVEFEFSDQLMPEYERAELPDYFELTFDDGRLLERSDSLHGRDLSVPEPPGREPRWWSAPLPDGRAGRYVAQLIEVHHVFPEEGPGRPVAAQVRIVIARGREELLAGERAMLAACGGVAAVLLGLLAFVSWRAVESGLAPAKRLAARLDAIEVERLPASLEAGDVPLELRPMAEKADALIRRVDGALKRERRTTADIAHELRTPITELLTASEVALRDGEDADGARRALVTVRQVAWRMARSVSTLLKLARLEMGAEAFEHQRVELGPILVEILRSLAAVQRERGLDVQNSVDGEPIDGDRDVLRIVTSNLLGNALHYCPPSTSVSCSLERSGGRWSLAVENDAPGLAPADLHSLSQPFWRKDRARSDRERSGLGLALSRALAEKAGMRLEFALEGERFRAVLSGVLESHSQNGAERTASAR